MKCWLKSQRPTFYIGDESCEPYTARKMKEERERKEAREMREARTEWWEIEDSPRHEATAYLDLVIDLF